LEGGHCFKRALIDEKKGTLSATGKARWAYGRAGWALPTLKGLIISSVQTSPFKSTF